MKQWHITENNLPNLIEKLSQLNFSKKWVVTITESKDKRSVDQNDRLWALYKSIGDHVGYTPDQVHDIMGYKFLRKQKTINNKTVEIIRSTTNLSIKEMAQYQESVELWAGQLGWSWDEQR